MPRVHRVVMLGGMGALVVALWSWLAVSYFNTFADVRKKARQLQASGPAGDDQTSRVRAAYEALSGLASGLGPEERRGLSEEEQAALVLHALEVARAEEELAAVPERLSRTRRLLERRRNELRRQQEACARKRKRVDQLRDECQALRAANAQLAAQIALYLQNR